MTPRLALFAYGSLASPQSASATLDRPVPPPLAAQLGGWLRRWSQARDNLAVEKTFARRDDGTLPSFVLALNIEPADADDKAPNGALLEVSEEELRRLDVREMRYDRIEVTEAVQAPAGLDGVFAYRAKRAQFAPRPPTGAVVIAAYVARVEAAFAALGEGQLDLYRATTGSPPVEVVEAELVRDRIPRGNPREW
jgi:hypothetical protein